MAHTPISYHSSAVNAPPHFHYLPVSAYPHSFVGQQYQMFRQIAQKDYVHVAAHGFHSSLHSYHASAKSSPSQYNFNNPSSSYKAPNLR